MTRALDRAVLQERLRLMAELVGDLEAMDAPSEALLGEDRLLRHAAERVLCLLVDLAVQVNTHVATAVLGRAPTQYRESFELAARAGIIAPDLASELASSVGLRNVLVHEYVAIDLAVVAASIPRAVVGFREYRRQVAGWLLTRQ